jgi:signal transduction histidine kinase
MFPAEESARNWLKDDRPPSGEATYRLQQICHDARQELALVIALADQIQTSDGLSREQHDQIATLRRVVADLAKTMRNVVSEFPVQQCVDISALVQEVGVQASLLSGSCVTAVVDEGLILECDPLQARRGMLNLLDNATRAAGPHGSVQLRATRTDAGLVIEVEDSGPGFGAAAPGLASLGLSVVKDWLAAAGGVLRIGDGGLGGALMELVFLIPRVPKARVPSTQLSR